LRGSNSATPIWPSDREAVRFGHDDRRSDGRRGAAMNDTAREDFKTALEGLIATARENGLSDEALIGELADAAEALREALS
jgi:hypothetical protein